MQARLFARIGEASLRASSLMSRATRRLHCCRAALTMRRTVARITMLAGVARALVSRVGPRVARPARQLRSSAPLRMAASTLEGLRNVAIVAHVRRSVRKQCRVKRVHSPRRRANAAPDARPQQRNVQPSRHRAVKNTHITRRSTTARRRSSTPSSRSRTSSGTTRRSKKELWTATTRKGNAASRS